MQLNTRQLAFPAVINSNQKQKSNQNIHRQKNILFNIQECLYVPFEINDSTVIHFGQA